MPPDYYILPITKIHSTFAEAKRFFDEYGGVVLFDDEEKLSVDTLAQGKRNLIVGEPGVGKSLLLQKIKEHLDIGGAKTTLIILRQSNVIEQLESFLQLQTEEPRALLLDALDEVAGSLFPLVIQKIDQISKKYSDLPMYISCRWVFVSQWIKSFPEYRFITISPFTRSQVRQYLIAAKHTEEDIDTLFNRITSFNHRMLVIQVPRYLSYLNEFLKKKGLDAAAKISRNDLFEYFIYSKIELEEKKINIDKGVLIKRLLEKLALTMEIYQTNTITKDELITFFDEIKSDLKLVALSQLGVEVFYEHSLLRVSQDDSEKIEFENTEFQEYLAAKEITRFSDPSRTAFAFAADPVVNEIYPTWFNAPTFLVDMRKDLLELLMEFSGLRGNRFKVMDEAFLTFLSMVDPQNVSPELRHQLFKDAIEYHSRTTQWLPGQLAQALPSFFDQSLEIILKKWIVLAEAQRGVKRFVPLGNVMYVVAYLLKSGLPIDRSYWRKELLVYASDKDSGVLQRHALLGLQWLVDPTIVDELPDMIDSEELVMREFLAVCAGLAPDHEKSIAYFFEAIRRNDFHGRYGLFAFKKSDSIKAFLRVFNNDERFRKEFMDDASIFQDQDQVLVDKIRQMLDEEMRELCKEALVKSVHINIAHNTDSSIFISGLWRLLREQNPTFVLDMVGRIRKGPDGKTGLYFAHDFFAQVIYKEDVVAYIKAMLIAKEQYAAHRVMVQIKLSGRSDAEVVYESGRSLLSECYKEWEDAQAKPDGTTPAQMHEEELLHEFRLLLEPAPGKYSLNVFEFYNEHIQDLNQLLTDKDRRRVEELLTGTVFKFINPGKYGLKINARKDGSQTYTTDTAVSIFREAIMTAKHLGFNTSAYRQQIINFIPFAYDDDLKVIFELVKNIKPGEISPVIEVYKMRHTDLWQHNPGSFVSAVEQYHITESSAVLKTLITEPTCEMHVRHEALTVLDSIAPDPDFLREVFKSYVDSVNEGEKKLSYISNGLLVNNHANAEAIRWRLGQIVERASAFIQTPGVHSIGELEDEISHSKTFAKPLIKFKYMGYEQDYLKLLDKAMNIWAKGKEFQEYAVYVWEIVYAYFDNLKEYRSYKPLHLLEEKITEMQGREGANWLAGRMVHLRRSYLTYVGKPHSISSAIARYNHMRGYNPKRIQNSADLFQHVQNGLETDLRRWIEGEGAYDLICGRKVTTGARQEYEKLIQKTLKTQIENILLKRGFQVEILQEPQLLDEKRVDFLVRYGFTGPIVVEIKLTSNSDMQGLRIERTASYKSMGRYMNGYGVSHGIFLVVNNNNAKNLLQIKQAFQKIKDVRVISFDCWNDAKKLKKKRPKNKGLIKKA